jgi:MFS family permease
MLDQAVHDNNEDDNAKLDYSIFIGVIALMILVSICTNFTEGVMADWTAVYMTDIAKSPKYMIGFGLTGYSFCMALGRLTGDALIPRFGRKNVLLLGSISCMIGMSIALIFPIPLICILGFSLVGFGVSFASPILYGSAARIPGYGNGKGLAIMNSFSMFGFLTGPVIIGFLSNNSDLRHALILLPILGLIWAIGSRFLKLY